MKWTDLDWTFVDMIPKKMHVSFLIAEKNYTIIINKTELTLNIQNERK